MKNKLFRSLALVAGSLALISMSLVTTDPQDPWEVPEEYQSMKNPYANTKDVDRIGRELYAKYCSSCHGKKGEGDGINSELLETPVADFTMDDFKNQSDGSLYYKIVKGRNEMLSFERIIPEEEDRWLVVNYVKAL